MTTDSRKRAAQEVKRLIREAAKIDVDIGNDEDWDEAIRLTVDNSFSISYTERL